jgi:hypothetical protein
MPILTCAGECTYYGEPQENPNVAMARVLTGGATKIAGLVMNGQVLKKALDAKNYIAPAAGASKEVYKEIMSDRVTNNSVTDRDHSNQISDTSVSDVRVYDTSVTDTSATNTSVFVTDTSVSGVTTATGE